MVSLDHYSQELSAQLGRAATRGVSHILINVRELHSSLGGFPNANDKMAHLGWLCELK
jgi:hypothetical protein